ncbi:MAG: TIGR04283 family arsenosugar biosynthesis glycosyltransferase [Paracoccaceae bacterium]
MPAEISAIIPTLNAGNHLAPCLGALMEGVTKGIIRELIISDGGSTDQTLTIAEEAGGTVITGPASRGGQLRRGCDAAAGDWLLILHADTQLDIGWSDRVQDYIQGPIKTPACFHLRFRAPGLMPRLTAGWANLRSRVFALPYGDQGLLVTRSDYAAAGGFPDQPLMEDVALIRALPRATLLASYANTGAERYVSGGWIKRGARNLWTLARYFAGASPEKLAQAYRK